jgi:hypothetical protein
MTRRGTTNGNARGNSRDRKVRKLWLLRQFGDGSSAPCLAELHDSSCPGTVTLETITVDRIVPGCDRGTYRRDNIRPAFGACNSKHGGSIRSSQTEGQS